MAKLFAEWDVRQHAVVLTIPRRELRLDWRIVLRGDEGSQDFPAGAEFRLRFAAPKAFSMHLRIAV